MLRLSLPSQLSCPLPLPRAVRFCPGAASSVLDKTLSCPWLRHRKWRENFTAAEFVPSHFPVPLPSCDVPHPGALTADSGPFPGALGKLWKGVGVISGVRVWERGGTAAEAESPLGSPRGCPSVHARHRAFMSPRAFSLSGATKQRWHVTPLPSPASDYGVDPAALFSFCVPAAPAFQRRVGGCQLGHGLQATGHVMLPRPLEGQAPPCPPPGDARCCCECVGRAVAGGPAEQAVRREEPAACPP